MLFKIITFVIYTPPVKSFRKSQFFQFVIKKLCCLMSHCTLKLKHFANKQLS